MNRESTPIVERNARRYARGIPDRLARLLARVYAMASQKRGSTAYHEERREVKLAKHALVRTIDELRRTEWRLAQRKAYGSLAKWAKDRGVPLPEQLDLELTRRIERIDDPDADQGETRW